jgi:hypothetical protein
MLGLPGGIFPLCFPHLNSTCISLLTHADDSTWTYEIMRKLLRSPSPFKSLDSVVSPGFGSRQTQNIFLLSKKCRIVPPPDTYVMGTGGKAAEA